MATEALRDWDALCAEWDRLRQDCARLSRNPHTPAECAAHEAMRTSLHAFTDAVRGWRTRYHGTASVRPAA